MERILTMVYALNMVQYGDITKETMKNIIHDVNTATSMIRHPGILNGETFTEDLSHSQHFLVSIGQRGIVRTDAHVEGYSEADREVNLRVAVDSATAGTASQSLDQAWHVVWNERATQRKLLAEVPIPDMSVIPLHQYAARHAFITDICTVEDTVHDATAIVVNSMVSGQEDLVRTIFNSWYTMMYENGLSKQDRAHIDQSSIASEIYTALNTVMATSIVYAVVQAERDMPYTPDVPFEWQMANMLPTICQHYAYIFQQLSQQILAGYIAEQERVA